MNYPKMNSTASVIEGYHSIDANEYSEMSYVEKIQINNDDDTMIKLKLEDTENKTDIEMNDTRIRSGKFKELSFRELKSLKMKPSTMATIAETEENSKSEKNLLIDNNNTQSNISSVTVDSEHDDYVINCEILKGFLLSLKSSLNTPISQLSYDKNLMLKDIIGIRELVNDNKESLNDVTSCVVRYIPKDKEFQPGSVGAYLQSCFSEDNLISHDSEKKSLNVSTSTSATVGASVSTTDTTNNSQKKDRSESAAYIFKGNSFRSSNSLNSSHAYINFSSVNDFATLSEENVSFLSSKGIKSVTAVVYDYDNPDSKIVETVYGIDELRNKCRSNRRSRRRAGCDDKKGDNKGKGDKGKCGDDKKGGNKGGKDCGWCQIIIWLFIIFLVIALIVYGMRMFTSRGVNNCAASLHQQQVLIAQQQRVGTCRNYGIF